MKTEYKEIAGVPAIIIGERSEKVYLFVHGKMGNKEEALRFAEIACPAGFQVVGIDLPEHGSRKDSEEKLLPRVVVPELRRVFLCLKEGWRETRIRANSIGAWFSMLAAQGEQVQVNKALLVSPIVDMEDLVTSMMKWAGVDEDELKRRGEIPTAFGETLSWEYLCWVRSHPLVWNVPTEILYAANDSMTPRSVINSFVAGSHASLTVMEEGEHWFHTEEQLHFLCNWEKDKL